jgi:Spy/CpxP family protein refolding chaperone
MKKNWITILIIFLLAANLSLFITIVVRDKCNTNFFDKKFLEHRGMHFNGDNQGNFEMQIAGKLNMSDKQKEQLKNLSSVFHKNKQELNDRINGIREKYFENLATNKPDNALLEELADSLGMLHARMIKLDHNHYQNLKSICTPEQAQKLDSLGRIHINNRMGDEFLDTKRRHEMSGKNCRNNN